MRKITHIQFKTKCGDFEVQDEILNNEDKKEESLELFSLDNRGLIRFCEKYIHSKVVDKMWNKIDLAQNGYIGMKHFPDLITFITILYLTKRRQQKIKLKQKPHRFVNNRQIRAEIEHFAVFIARKYIYNEYDEFMLTKNDFRDKFVQWCDAYVDDEGFCTDFQYY